MTVRVNLPRFMTARSADATVEACSRLIQAETEANIEAANLRFLDPFGVTMLGATFGVLYGKGCEVKISNLAEEVATYLDRMDVLGTATLINTNATNAQNRRHDRRDSLVELTKIDDANDINAAAHSLASAIVGHIPGIENNEPPDEMSGYTTIERLMEPLQYALGELLENSLSHARKLSRNSSVWVAAQYYPKNGRLQFGVVDNGCGFLNSLGNHPQLRQQDHLSAILLALQPRISCNRDLSIGIDSVNQGVGLTTTHRIAQQAMGGLTIVSGDGCHRTTATSETLNAHWPGSAIAFECRRHNLDNVRFRELLPPLEGVPSVKIRFEP